MVNEHHDLNIAKKEKDNLDIKYKDEQKKNEEAKTKYAEVKNQVEKLTHIIKEAHEEHERLKKDY